MKQAVSKFNTFLENKRRDLDSEIDRIRAVVRMKKSQADDLEASVAKASADIDTFSDRVVSLVKFKQAELKQELKQSMDMARKEMTGDTKQEEMKLEEAQQRRGLIAHALQSDTDMDHYEMYKMCRPEVIQLQSHDKEKQNDRVIQIEYDGTEIGCILADLDKKGLGMLVTSRDQATPTTEDMSSKIHEPEDVQDISSKKRELLNEIDTDIRKLCGITVLTHANTKVVVCAGDFYVKVFFTVDNKLNQSSLYLGSTPTGLCKISESQGAVSIHKSRQIIEFEVKPTIKPTRTLATQRGYMDIAYTGKSTIAGLFADRDESQKITLCGIDVIDMSGRMLRTFGSNCFQAIASSNNTMLLLWNSQLNFVSDQGEILLKSKLDSVTACSVWNVNMRYVYLCCGGGGLWNTHTGKWSPYDINVFSITDTGIQTELMKTKLPCEDREARERYRLIATDAAGYIYIADDRFIKIFGFK